MKTLLAKAFLPVTLLAAAALLYTPPPAKAGAELIKGTCFTTTTATTPTSLYLGHFTTVATPSGRINAHCNADLVDGPGVTKTVHDQGMGDYGQGQIPCDFVLNPGGHANAECHN